jgi:hypothetical protein
VELLKEKALSSRPSTAKKKNLRKQKAQVLVAHTYNPSYSGERDQEDHSLKPAWENSI